MLSQPFLKSFAQDHQTGTLGRHGSIDSNNINRTSSFSSLLFARRPSLSESVVSSSPRIYSPLRRNILPRPQPLTTELDHCWGGGRRRSRELHLNSNTDFYEFLKEVDLDAYYTVLSKHLKIRTPSQLKYVTDIELSEMGLSRPEIRRLKKHFEREFPQTAIGRLKKKLARSTSAKPSSSTTEPLEVDGSFPVCNEAKNVVGYRLIPASELELVSSLGQGEFGHVHQGTWRPVALGRQLQVAVKVLDMNRFPTRTDDFLKEAAIMNSLDHPDIVQLYGICVASNCLKLVTELAPLRSLLECLREANLRPSFPVSTLHNLAIQIARGMAYLEGERLVHRDLAARNILVFAKDRVKIGDFGLSRGLQLGKSYYQTNLNANLRLPIAWCALEAIHDLRFTSASDVWAYGVTLWEMFTYGFVPWAGLSGKQILEAVDMPNCCRLSQPDACPDAVFDAVLRACWNHEPNSRPTFAQLTEILPHLSPQSWTVIDDHLDAAGDSPPKSVGDIRTLLREENEAVNEDHHAPSNTNQLRRCLLRVRAGETVYVLSKRDTELWKVMSHATSLVGYVAPENLRAVASPSHRQTTTGALSHSHSGGHTFSRMRLRFSRRESCRNSPKGSKKLTRDLISLPQNDFRHIGHVGADGSVFGDVGFSLDFDEENRDPSPVDSCEAFGSSSDKENPRLSDITLSEQPQSTRGSAEVCERVSSMPLGSSESPPEKKQSANPTHSPLGLTDSWFPHPNSGVGDVETSILDMGSSFMDEIFQCLSERTEGIGISTANAFDATTQSAVREPLYAPSSECIVVSQEPPSTPSISKSKSPWDREDFLPDSVLSSPPQGSTHSGEALLSSGQTTAPPPPTTNGLDCRSSRVDTSSRRFRSSVSGVGGGHGSGSGAFMNATTSTLTRAFRKSSASLTRRPSAQKAPSALSLEQSRAPLIKARLEAPSKSRRPVISGPIMIGTPMLVTGCSTTSIPSSESTTTTTTTAAISSPPLSLRATSRGSSVSAFSSPFLASRTGDPGANTTCSTTPSISPAPSTSSLATSSNSSSNLYIQNRVTSSATVLPSNCVGGLRALRTRSDLAFRAPNSTVAGGGGKLRVNLTGTSEDHYPSLPNEKLPLNSDATTISPSATFMNCDSTGRHVLHSAMHGRLTTSQHAKSSRPESHHSSSIMSLTSREHASTSPPPSETIQQKRSLSRDSTSTKKSPRLSGEIDTGLSDELLNFWGSEFANLLNGAASASS